MQVVVVFDGECGLCNGFVAWLVRRDTRARCGITGSASPAAQSIMQRAGLGSQVGTSTIVVWDGTRAWLRSAAIVRILRAMGWPWALASATLIVPRPVRDAIYRAVARRRPRIPHGDAACGVPPMDMVATWRARLVTMDDVDALAR